VLLAKLFTDLISCIATIIILSVIAMTKTKAKKKYGHYFHMLFSNLVLIRRDSVHYSAQPLTHVSVTTVVITDDIEKLIPIPMLPILPDIFCNPQISTKNSIMY